MGSALKACRYPYSPFSDQYLPCPGEARQVSLDSCCLRCPHVHCLCYLHHGDQSHIHHPSHLHFCLLHFSFSKLHRISSRSKQRAFTHPFLTTLSVLLGLAVLYMSLLLLLLLIFIFFIFISFSLNCTRILAQNPIQSNTLPFL